MDDFNFGPSAGGGLGDAGATGGAGGGGGGGSQQRGLGAQSGKAQTKGKPNNLNCSICRKTNKDVASNKDGGVRCGICQFWWHSRCLNMDSDLLNWIVMGEKLGNDCCWTCQHCQEAHIKTEQAIMAMSSRMKTVEQRVDKCEDSQL